MVTGAIRLQQRRASRARRAFAAIAALWLVTIGVLGARHEAEVAHVRDLITGELRHASGMIGQHTSDQSDVHGSPAQHSDNDACWISAAIQPAQAAAARPALRVPPAAIDAIATPVLVFARAETIFRLAPKTSPPSFA